MKKTINYFMLLATMTTIMSCNNSTNPKTNDTKVIYSELDKASWLIGEWQNHSSKGNSTEIWEKKNDSTFIGISFFVVGKDTVSSETISMEQKGDELFYVPTVKDQNDGQPVKFKLTSLTTKQFVFENPTHYFPQKITYTQITKDSLLAEISGIMKGKQNSQKFPMKRIK